jgi:hypothetical protein
MLDLERLCICVETRFVCVGMASDHRESHMVLQACRFDLDDKDEVSYGQPLAMVLRKKNDHGFL